MEDTLSQLQKVCNELVANSRARYPCGAGAVSGYEVSIVVEACYRSRA